MSSKNRSLNFHPEKDMHLSRVWLDVSQNPIIGCNQNDEHFWGRVEKEYNSTRPSHLGKRVTRALENRWGHIRTAILKLRACIEQVEDRHPSGASEQDILDQAKVLMMQDPPFKKGFRFDHVWPILKDCQKFGKDVEADLPQYEIPNFHSEGINVDNISSKSQMSTTVGLSSFSIDINEDSPGGSSSQRPIGVKKAKGKRKTKEESSKLIAELVQERKEVAAAIVKGNEDRLQNYELQKALIMSSTYASENAFLAKDANSISNPELREELQREQLQIIHKRRQEWEKE